MCLFYHQQTIISRPLFYATECLQLVPRLLLRPRLLIFTFSSGWHESAAHNPTFNHADENKRRDQVHAVKVFSICHREPLSALTHRDAVDLHHNGILVSILHSNLMGAKEVSIIIQLFAPLSSKATFRFAFVGVKKYSGGVRFGIIAHRHYKKTSYVRIWTFLFALMSPKVTFLRSNGDFNVSQKVVWIFDQVLAPRKCDREFSEHDNGIIFSVRSITPHCTSSILGQKEASHVGNNPVVSTKQSKRNCHGDREWKTPLAPRVLVCA